MRRLSMNKKTEQKRRKICKVDLMISKLPIIYIILNHKQIYHSKSRLLHFTLLDVKFDVDDISNAVNSKSKCVHTKDIELMTYSPDNSIICITLKDNAFHKLFPFVHGENLLRNSVWFCVQKVDIANFKSTCQTLTKCYNGVFPVEPLSEDIYSKFTTTVSTYDTDDAYVNDWGYYITPTMQSSRKSTRCEPLFDKLVYSASSMHNVEVTVADVACLAPGKCLNDAIINFYLIYIYHELLDPDQQRRSHFFNLFFNTKLRGTEIQQQTDTPETRHARVAKWTKNVDIFEKDFLIIPVIEETHWFIVIVCFPWMVGMVDYQIILGKGKNKGPSDITENNTPFATLHRQERLDLLKQKPGANPMPCILIFDSMTLTARSPKVKIVRDYLKSEWDLRRADKDGTLIFDRNTCRGYLPKVPQQDNVYDCGIYLLHYVEMFFKEPVEDYSLEYFKLSLFHWFDNSDVPKKRKQIKDAIKKKLNSNAVGGVLERASTS